MSSDDDPLDRLGLELTGTGGGAGDRAGWIEVAGEARLDLDRQLRKGVPEVILARGKGAGRLPALVEAMVQHQGRALVSRMTLRQRRVITRMAFSAGLDYKGYGGAAIVALPGRMQTELHPGRVALLTAGSSDLDCALEARMVVEAAGLACSVWADVGVAGLHRLVAPLAELRALDPDAVIVAAGMDGALASVVCGLVKVPVIGLPVATGYGLGGRGRAALLSMLQTCSPGMAVVNIDNGIGAGAMAAAIALRAAYREERRSRPRKATST